MVFRCHDNLEFLSSFIPTLDTAFGFNLVILEAKNNIFWNDISFKGKSKF